MTPANQMPSHVLQEKQNTIKVASQSDLGKTFLPNQAMKISETYWQVSGREVALANCNCATQRPTSKLGSLLVDLPANYAI